MSLARPIHSGSRYLLTRRTTQRQFLLRPSEATNQIVLYSLAYAALVTGVIVHAFVAMSNHIHAVVTDPDSRLPQFLHLLDRHIACCMNISLGRTENFWASTQASAVTLETEDDVADMIAYVIANPTTAGLVADPAQWPGVVTRPDGLRTTVQRPNVFFRPNGKMPASIELQVRVPAPLGGGGVDAIVTRVRELLELKLSAAKTAMAAARRAFLGRNRVLATSVTATPSTLEPIRALRPRFAVSDPERRRGVLERLRAFYGHYARALAAWVAGDRTAVFPAGTYLMRVLHGAMVEHAPR